MARKNPLAIHNLDAAGLSRLVWDLNQVNWPGLHANLYGPDIQIGVQPNSGKFFVNLTGDQAHRLKDSLSETALIKKYQGKEE